MTDMVTKRMGVEESRARIRETLEEWAQQKERRGQRTEDRGPRTKEEERRGPRIEDRTMAVSVVNMTYLLRGRMTAKRKQEVEQREQTSDRVSE